MRRPLGSVLLVLGLLSVSSALASASQDERAAGDLTVTSRTSRAYGQPGPTLNDEQRAQFMRGDGAFEATFVAGAAPTNSGLGPRFNNASCAACHVGDGRGRPVVGGGALRSMALVRVSQSSGAGVPGIGFQLRDHATYGLAPDALVGLNWQTRSGQYVDGEPFELREPRLDIKLPDGQALGGDVMTSLRMAPPVFGRGLLEAVAEEQILALVDPDDADSDGISGRANYVTDAHGQSRLGRFGLKANTADLLEQTAAAYVNDMGVTNPLFPDADGSVEVDQATLDDVAFYTRTLAVPARRPNDAADRGEALFGTAGCAACHTPTLTTAPSDIGALDRQTIHPYTDLLLHDLGPDLADGRPDFQAGGAEWRTPPLWGIGLTETVLGGPGNYLHDGRARTLGEAILWHGGAASAAREWFVQASPADRASLLAFLRSL